MKNNLFRSNFNDFYSPTAGTEPKKPVVSVVIPNRQELKNQQPVPINNIDIANRTSLDKQFLSGVLNKYEPNKLDIFKQRPPPEEAELVIIQSTPKQSITRQPIITQQGAQRSIEHSIFPNQSQGKQQKLTEAFDRYSHFKYPLKPLQTITGIDSKTKYMQKQLQTNKTVVNLSKMDQKDFDRLVEELAAQKPMDKQYHQQLKEKKAMEEISRKMMDKQEILRGEQLVKEFIRDELQSSRQPMQILKRKEPGQAPAPSQTLSTYNQLLHDQRNYLQGTPVVDFSFYLEFLFKSSYHKQDKVQDHKIIPNSFKTSEEYQTIFDYLFCIESLAQVKQELNKFIYAPKQKYRKLQVKFDDTQQDKHGTILCVRAPEKQDRLELDDVQAQHDDDDSDDPMEQIKDGNCDLMILKNYIVVLSQSLKLNEKNFNQFGQPKSFIFGWLLDPQKTTFLNQVRILTFTDRNTFKAWTDVILIPFAKITTQLREFQMIRNLDQEDISKIILDPNRMRPFVSDADRKGTAIVNQNVIPDPKLLNRFLDSIRPHYNESQFKCIREISLINNGVCLLQGPPGTGKTHTLLGIVSAVYTYMAKLGMLGEKKILICAPSNAAIDEVLTRIIKGGLRNEYGDSFRPKVLRIGPVDTSEAHDQQQISKFSLEEIAQKQLFEEEKYRVQTDQRTTGDVRAELQRVQHSIDKIDKQRKNGQSVDQTEFQNLWAQKRQLATYLDQLKGVKRSQKENYKKHMNLLLEQAEIICTTLSSSGSDKLDRFKGLIDVLIIDEAAQCTEPTNLIPLRLSVRKMILIGDPKQLPATTFSHIANKALYNRSLFERIISNDFTPYFLSIQYRMHEDIRHFPSKYFYGAKLTDHPSIAARGKDHPCQVALLDCQYGKEESVESSQINETENQIVQQLLKYFREFTPFSSIGVICGYKAQVKLIKKTFKAENAAHFKKDIMSINTVDSFQGQEKDIIIFSCVRSSEKRQVGFMSDQRRINVALTRAKSTIIIVGDCNTLSSDLCWKSLILDFIKRDKYFFILNEEERYDLVNRVLTKQEHPFDSNQFIQKKEVPPKTLLEQLHKETKGKTKQATFNMNDFKDVQELDPGSAEEQQVKESFVDKKRKPPKTKPIQQPIQINSSHSKSEIQSKPSTQAVFSPRQSKVTCVEECQNVDDLFNLFDQK